MGRLREALYVHSLGLYANHKVRQFERNTRQQPEEFFAERFDRNLNPDVIGTDWQIGTAFRGTGGYRFAFLGITPQPEVSQVNNPARLRTIIGLGSPRGEDNTSQCLLFLQDQNGMVSASGWAESRIASKRPNPSSVGQLEKLSDQNCDKTAETLFLLTDRIRSFQLERYADLHGTLCRKEQQIASRWDHIQASNRLLQVEQMFPFNTKEAFYSLPGSDNLEPRYHDLHILLGYEWERRQRYQFKSLTLP